jgi:hypothetical protein
MDFSTLVHVEASKHDIQNLVAIAQMTVDGTPPDGITAVIRIIEGQERQDPRDLRNVRVAFEIQPFRPIGIN